MNIKRRLEYLENSCAADIRILILYDGEIPQVGDGGLTVIVRKPGHRP